MSKSNRIIDPSKDGIEFINIWTKGKTRLGRLMTNLADISVEHPKYGKFRTGEGLWYYMKTGCEHEDLRAMSGFDAKRFGMALPKVWMSDFEQQFMIGIRCKLEGHQELKDLFIASELPFEHYYVYGGDKGKVVEPSDVKWLTQYWTDLRTELQM